MANKMLIDATHPEETRVVVLRGNRVEEFDFESAYRRQLRGNIYLAKVTRVEPSLQAAFVDYGGNRHGFLAFSEIHPDYYQIPVADRQALIEEEERAQRAADAESDARVGRRRGRRSRGAGRSDERVVSEAAAAEAEEPAGESVKLPAAELASSELFEEVEAFAPPGLEEHESKSEPSGEETADAPARTESREESSASSPAESEDEIRSRQVAFGREAEEQHDAAAERMGDAEANSDTHEARADDDNKDRDDEDDRDRADDGDEFGPERALAAADVDRESGDFLKSTDDQDESDDGEDGENGEEAEEEIIESVGGADAMEEVPERTTRMRRQYKIQEVIKRRQVMLVQVVKEERGTKGAALTTYLSLAGRYSVLMPNTARGGGISRKITNMPDRKRLKEIAQDLEVPEGMGVILRTAGANRTKTEIKRDFEYLLRLWETVRDLTLKSTAPTLVYEEGSLVKRSIRDLYNKDIDEVLVAGEPAYRDAKDFMRMLMPSHAKNVKLYKDAQPLFARYGIENQLDAMFSPVVQLRSGGYIVINQTEALVAIDVNSGRSTREHHIEDTALKTNLEAAEEVSRQLRLRDLAGLIVIDFIDMDEKRNNRAVERRLKECLKHDRARIQVGHISHFGLLEMSRQRLRSSVFESSTEKCPHCGGTGHIRSVSSVALQLLRGIEEALLKGATHNLIVRTRSEVAIYVLNHKRAHLRDLEDRFRIVITVSADESLEGQTPFTIERGEQVHSVEEARALARQAIPVTPVTEEEAAEEEAFGPEEEEEVAETEEVAEIEAEGEAERSEEEREARPRRRRRRRGRGGSEAIGAEPAPQEWAGEEFAPAAEGAEPAGRDIEREGEEDDETAAVAEGEGDARRDDGERRRRRGRRGGRRNRRGGRDREGAAPSLDEGPTFESEIGEAVADFDVAPPANMYGYDDQEAPPAPPAPSVPSEAVPPAPIIRHESWSAEPPPETMATPATVQPEEPVEPPPLPRRRSTVREPVSLFARAEDAGVETTVTPPEPVMSAPPPPAEEPVASESVEDAKPRRSGWWSRRLLGKS